MEDDKRENILKIISAKTKQIQIQSEKYESQIRSKVKEIIELEKKIKNINNSPNLSETENEEKIRIENEIKDKRKSIKLLTKEKQEALGCDINIGFTDDHYIKSDFDL